MNNQTPPTGPQVHHFDDSGDAYDASQCRDEIRSGDVLVIAAEGVIGVLVEAWPVAITREAGAFHQTGPRFDWAAVNPTMPDRPAIDLTASLALAQSEAARCGAPLAD